MDKELLVNEYIVKNKTLKEVALFFNKSEAATKWWLAKYKIRKPSKSIDLTGKIFGRLTVIDRTTILYSDKLKPGWRCLCSCGKEIKTVQYSLLRGLTKSCGCYFKEVRFKGIGELSGQQWSRISHQARTRGIEFNITKEYAYKLFLLQNRKCALSGLSIKLNKNYQGIISENTASLDRIDSTKGYIEGNVQWTHKTINIMKNNMTEKEFYNLCKTIVDYFDDMQKLITD